MYLTISNFKSFQKQIIQSDQSQGILKKRLGKYSIISTAYKSITFTALLTGMWFSECVLAVNESPQDLSSLS